MHSNSEIIDEVSVMLGVDNDNQLAKLLTEKYNFTVTRQSILQFRRTERHTITHFLLKEVFARLVKKKAR